jgi:ATP-dependent Clp protease ATP-binding subunit ClpC
MFERFTDRARRAVVLAQEEARMLHHDFIGTEHLLLGILHEGDGSAARVLQGLDISLEPARREVAKIRGRGLAAPAGHIAFTPRARKVLELSLPEALQLGHTYTGTEHILLSLVREGDGVAVQVLVRLGTDLNRVREEVIRLIPGGQGDSGRRALPAVLSRLDLIESRLTTLDAEVDRLRGLLRQHGIDPAA